MRSSPEDMRVIFRILKKGKKGKLKAVWKCEKRERQGKVKCTLVQH
jgi:hypothetical protein